MSAFMTPLRWLIASAYLCVGVASFIYWQEIGTFVEFFAGNSIRFLKAVTGLLVALLTLKLGIVFTTIFTALVIVLKVALGILITALLPGTLKAIVLPLVFDFLSFIHRKSHRLQQFVSWLLDWSKGQYAGVSAWWRDQYWIDKWLIASLAFLLVPILGLVFFYKRFILPFLVTKLGENFVQRGVRFLWVSLKRSTLMKPVFYTLRCYFVLSKRAVRRQNRRLTMLRQRIVKKPATR